MKTNGELIHDLIRREGFTYVVAVSFDWTLYSKKKVGVQYLQDHGVPVQITSPREAPLWLRAVDDPEHTLVYMVSYFGHRTYQTHRAIAMYGYRYLGRYMGLLPAPTRKVLPSFGSAKAWALLRAADIVKRYPYIFGVTPADYLIHGGRQSHFNVPYPISPDTQYINGHAEDYDRYIELMRGERIEPREPTAVFLDGDDFHHPDLHLVIGRTDHQVWEEAYFAQLRRFFDMIEYRLGVRVIIAAHPLTTTLNRAKFGNREVIQGRTAELVMDAKVVIAHYSTAINLGVIFGKPILLITDRNYERSWMGPHIEATARALNKDPVHIDGEVFDCDALKVDHAAYRRYMNEYIREDL